MKVAEHRMRIDADVAELAAVRAFVRDAARAADAPIDCLDDLVQAVDEAATNVITHGYGRAHGWLEISVALADDRFVVTIEDAAPGFDPTAAPEPDLSLPPLARRPGGMGIHLIRAATDELRYRPRPGGGNILTLIRSREPGRKEDG
jgi:anti-sigma regulatory factor (Ser/Thr protein kinase)